MRKPSDETHNAGRNFLATIGAIAVVASLLTGMFAVPSSRAQTPTPAADRPAFDTASVKTGDSADQHLRMNWQPGGRYTADIPLRPLIAAIYLDSFTKSRLVFGGPSWVDSKRFIIEAKADSNPTGDQRWLLVRTLLEDRFKLILHHQTRQLPVYALVHLKAGKLGPQLTLHSADAKCAEAGAGKPLAQPGAGEAMPAYCGGFFMNPRPGDLRETGNAVTMDMFGPFLTQSVDRPILNKTGLAGTYDFSIEFSPEQGPGAPVGDAATAPDSSAQPSIFTAIEQQLGLKLEAQMGPIDVIVIDHVEEPSPN